MITTFGHSTLDQDAGLALLDSAGVDVLIDVRSHPTSRWEQWRRENLVHWVGEASQGGIEYQWWPELGGWDVRHSQDDRLREAMHQFGVDLAAYSGGAFPKQRIAATTDAPADPDKPEWTNVGLRDYSWFTATQEFQQGLDRLIAAHGDPAGTTAAIMCAESLWWKCHRSMIADALAFRGVEAWHIQPKWTPHGRALSNRIERYPAIVREAWERWPQ